MAKQKKDKIDLLLSKLDKTQFADFIRKECSNNRQFQDRFLALGAGTLFKPEPKKYASRVKSGETGACWDSMGVIKQCQDLHFRAGRQD